MPIMVLHSFFTWKNKRGTSLFDEYATKTLLIFILAKSF